jgi:hypothetical protein
VRVAGIVAGAGDDPAILAACAWAATAVVSVTIQWIGDIALGESFGLPPGGLSGALAPVRRYLEQAKVTIGCAPRVRSCA